MRLKQLELSGFKSFAKKTSFLFDTPIAAIVGPNGSGKSNAAEAFRWVLGERSLKSLRGQKGEDLIFNGGHGGARQSRAAVSLTFDNHDRIFDLDYQEVTIAREVFRDGNNVYSINGSPVRYRDLLGLLAGARLGGSDNFIIHQGEADRVLAASPSERRSLVEDALGLRLYQWKIGESEKKLEQTAVNLERVASLRREIAPHLKFLKKQVERLEQADRLRQDLKTKYWEYLKREEVYLTEQTEKLKAAQRQPEQELAALTKQLAKLTAGESDLGREQSWEKALNEAAEDLRNLARQKEEESRKLGRLEGMMELKSVAAAPDERAFPFAEVAGFVRQLTDELEAASRLSDVFSLRGSLERLKELARHFLKRGGGAGNEPEKELAALRSEAAGIQARLSGIDLAEKKGLATKAKLEKERADYLESLRAAEHETFALKTRRNELTAQLSALASETAHLRTEQSNWERELAEAKVLVNQEIMLYRNFVVPSEAEPRVRQEERRRDLERLKIKLEDLGVESGDTLKEYRETSERDLFLAQEMTDLEQAEKSLRAVIADLRQKINQEFEQGLKQINQHFQEFFALMFGGGSASLNLWRPAAAAPEPESESEPVEAGLDIKVSLPRKKLHDLNMLSGGERALLSIALLFAFSQVNPPPFLVLDETDAALDEANSRKYGDMIEKLAARSQLILITHNRETMSRAGVIYGVTMSGDGMSKLLSIKFDEAAAFAK